MLYKLLYAFFFLFSRDYIPPLPRGMLASHFEDVATPERRALARMGARDIRGVKIAMKRAGVTTLDELVDQLEHYRPERRIGQRIHDGLGRVVGGYERDPYEDDIKRLNSRFSQKKSHNLKPIKSRVQLTKQAFKNLP